MLYDQNAVRDDGENAELEPVFLCYLKVVCCGDRGSLKVQHCTLW